MIKNSNRIVSVKCSITGKESYVNPEALANRLKKYGSIEEIEKQWVSREGKKILEEEKQKLEEEKEWGDCVDLTDNAVVISHAEANRLISITQILNKQ